MPDAGDLLDEAETEHQQARELIASIQARPKAGPELDELVAELNREIEHHVKEERDHLFPKARAARGLDLAQLGSRLRQRQQELQASKATA